MTAPRRVTDRQLAANRANARHATGPLPHRGRAGERESAAVDARLAVVLAHAQAPRSSPPGPDPSSLAPYRYGAKVSCVGSGSHAVLPSRRQARVARPRTHASSALGGADGRHDGCLTQQVSPF